MDPLAQKQQPQQTYQPPRPVQQPQPQPQPQAPQGNLKVPVVSPTHFDSQHSSFNHSVGVPTQLLHPDNPEIERLRKDLKVKKIFNVILFVFMLVFLVAGILGFVLYLDSNDKLETAQKDIKNKNAIISALEESTGVSNITSPDQVPAYQTPHGYIYIDSWKIKLQVPEELTSVSYTLDEKEPTQICFNAIDVGIQSFPAFADIDQNPGGMGCLTRVAISEGDINKATGLSFGELVLTHGDYNFFYAAPAYYSQVPAEQELERNVVQKIKTMLTKNVSIYE